MSGFILAIKKIAKRSIIAKKLALRILDVFREKSHNKMLNYINKNYKHLFEKYEKSMFSIESADVGGGVLGLGLLVSRVREYAARDKTVLRFVITKRRRT